MPCTSVVLFIDRACIISAGRLLSLASLASALQPLSTRSTSKPMLRDRSLQIPDAPTSLASPPTRHSICKYTPVTLFLSLVYLAFLFSSV
jgi:hypothetical protein